MIKVRKMHIPPTALGPASGLSAVLGRDALDSRATAFKPDVVDVISKRRMSRNVEDCLVHKQVIHMFLAIVTPDT
jgi:hypothetical protein